MKLLVEEAWSRTMMPSWKWGWWKMEGAVVNEIDRENLDGGVSTTRISPSSKSASRTCPSFPSWVCWDLDVCACVLWASWRKKSFRGTLEAVREEKRGGEVSEGEGGLKEEQKNDSSTTLRNGQEITQSEDEDSPSRS